MAWGHGLASRLVPPGWTVLWWDGAGRGIPSLTAGDQVTPKAKQKQLQQPERSGGPVSTLQSSPS